MITADMRFVAVAIGRNEGDRLRKCIDSLGGAAAIIYVDSGSTDGSVQWARSRGADVVELDCSIPFTAARARNAGLERMRHVAPDVPYVQFIDGDCEMIDAWPAHAIALLDARRDIAAVCGRLRERYPHRSVYNWLCEREWAGDAGEVRACGGIALMRAAVVVEVGAFREDLIAGEEPELCVRLRAAGWHIWRLDAAMALHDAAMTYFSQWWRRAMRGGYGFAQGADLHGDPPEYHYVWETRRAVLWGIVLPALLFVAGIALAPWGFFAWAIYPAQVVRLSVRNSGSIRERTTLALFHVLARFPEGLGVVKFKLGGWLRRPSRIIEYK